MAAEVPGCGAGGSGNSLLKELARWTFGVVLVTWRYLWTTTVLHRWHQPGGVRDAPPALPVDVLDEHSQLLAHGCGALYHRTFEVHVLEPSLSARQVIDALAEDLNRGVPSEVTSVSALDARSGRLLVGEEVEVRMPGPYNGPVRVVHRDATSFRLATLHGHMEAGQIEFRARDTDAGLCFEIEAWARPRDRLFQLLYHYLWLAREIQLNMWVRFCLNAARVARGRPASGVTIGTRVVAESDLLNRCIRAERSAPASS